MSKRQFNALVSLATKQGTKIETVKEFGTFASSSIAKKCLKEMEK